MLLACGFALGRLAGLELAAARALRGLPLALDAAGRRRARSLVAVPLFLWPALPQVALLVVGVVVFAVVLTLLRRAFRARSGGLGFRA